jgi:hypothetical protein
MAFGSVYPLLVAKAERKGRTAEEVDVIITWGLLKKPITLILRHFWAD